MTLDNKVCVHHTLPTSFLLTWCLQMWGKLSHSCTKFQLHSTASVLVDKGSKFKVSVIPEKSVLSRWTHNEEQQTSALKRTPIHTICFYSDTFFKKDRCVCGFRGLCSLKWIAVFKPQHWLHILISEVKDSQLKAALVSKKGRQHAVDNM